MNFSPSPSEPLNHLAHTYLKVALDNPLAEFHPGQWESIEQLLARKRVLVVQRTGWGKSMVYFIATKLLRERGAGPTLLISPLLSLMRNQLEAARRLGINACTINSTNTAKWDAIQDEIAANQVDLLLISPERLANDVFRQHVLAGLANHIGLFAIDEAHCISDWGHDFRPDYRRIVRVLQAVPANVPVLATTATANNRVVADVKSQLGDTIILQRGSLVRKSLKLQNIHIPRQADRMAWLARTLPELPGSGIVYTLTQRDAEQVARWLHLNGIQAAAYHAGMGDKAEEGPTREKLEHDLLNNAIKALVATVALGMGFDKPDLGFVIHFQRPASVVHYYQQVGRAGRGVEEAYGILLCGEEDDRIADYFIRTAFPPQQHVAEILEVLDKAEHGLSAQALQKAVNLRKGQIDSVLKFLTVESPSPITKIGSVWRATAVASTYQVDKAYVDAITAIRNAEQREMRDYMTHPGCLMAFLQNALDDPVSENCGKCRNCAPELLLAEQVDEALAKQAELFLRGSHQKIHPKKRWPAKHIFRSPLFLPMGNTSAIPKSLQAEEGRVLSQWRDAGWGTRVAREKTEAGRFSDDLVTACVDMLKKWSPDPPPKWVTCIPSLVYPDRVPDFAARVAGELGLRFGFCFEKQVQNQMQQEMVNSYQQVRNLDGAFDLLIKPGKYAPCFLIDDVMASGWTLTVAAALLRQAGCAAVYPVALALNTTKMD